jgi:hypothetical protein
MFRQFTIPEIKTLNIDNHIHVDIRKQLLMNQKKLFLHKSAIIIQKKWKKYKYGKKIKIQHQIIIIIK